MLPSANVVKYAPNSFMARHSHSNARLCVVLAGGFEESEGTDRRVHRSGVLLYRPEDTRHAQKFGSRGALCVLMSPSAEWIAAAKDHNIDPQQPAVVESSEIARLGIALHRECERWDDLSALVCEGIAWESLALIGREISQNKRPLLAPARRAADYLRENLATQMSITALAACLRIHPATLCRQFRSSYGESIGGYRRRLRVERASTLLHGTDTSIADIALISGFASQAHLTTVLRHALGITPARLRRLRRI